MRKSFLYVFDANVEIHHEEFFHQSFDDDEDIEDDKDDENLMRNMLRRFDQQ